MSSSIGKNAAECGPCRSKPKSAVAQSPEEQARQEADEDLLKKIEAGDIAGVKAMLEGGQSPNVGDENGQSSMHKVMLVRDSAVAQQVFSLLLEHGAFADYTDSYGKRPLSVCMEQGDSAAAALLLAALLELKDAGGSRIVDLTSINPKTGNTLVMDACWVGNLTATRALLATGAFEGKLEASNKQGQTAIHVAAFRASKEVVQALHEAGADVNAVEKSSRRISKESAEGLAAAMGRSDTADFLREMRAAADAVRFAAKMKIKGKQAGAAKEADAAA